MSSFIEKHLNDAFKEDHIETILFIIMCVFVTAISHALSYAEIFADLTSVQLTSIFEPRMVDIESYFSIFYFRGFKFLIFNTIYFAGMEFLIPIVSKKFPNEENWIIGFFVISLPLLTLLFFDIYVLVAILCLITTILMISFIFNLKKDNKKFYSLIVISIISTIFFFCLTSACLARHYTSINDNDYIRKICNKMNYIIVTDTTGKNSIGWKIKEDEKQIILRTRIDDSQYETIYINKSSVRYLANLETFGNLLKEDKKMAFEKCLF